MNLYDLFKLDEGYRVLPNYDTERYSERPGLEGPMRARNGKVVYYDPREGRYYDPDSDMYIDNETWDMMNENDEDIATTKKAERMLQLLRRQNPGAQNDIEALLLAFEKGQKQDRSDINTLYSQNREEEMDIAALERALEKLKRRSGVDEAMDPERKKALDAAMANLRKQFPDMKTGKYTPPSAEELAKRRKEQEQKAMEKAKAKADMLMKLADEHGENISAKEVGYFAKGIADGKSGYIDRKAGDAYGPNVYAYDAGVRVGEKLKNINEDYYETDEQRELARLGRILMDMGAKRDDAVGAAMGAVGNELTKYGTPQGVSTIEKLEKVTGQPESVIMKMMALAQKVQGDVAVGDETAGNDDEDEVKEAKMGFTKIPYSGYKGPGSDYRAYDEPDTKNNYEVKIDGKPWKVFRNEASAKKAAHTIEMKYGKKTTVFATTKPVSEGIAEDFDKNFSKRIGYTVRGGAAADMMKKQAAQAQADNPDAGKGLGPGVLDIAKARKKAKEKGVRAPGNLRASPNTRDPKRLPEAESPMVTMTIPNVTFDMAQKLERHAKENNVDYSRQGRTVVLKGPRIDMTTIRTKMGIAQTNLKMEPVTEELSHNIRIGDTVETKKMGQMQGVVTGFSTKYGDTRVMFKHKSGKVYATPANNLRVIDSKKTESLDDTVVEAKKKPVPTDPSKWSYYKSQAKKKFDVYPSAYANAWAAKQYKAAGGGWRMGKPKK